MNCMWQLDVINLMGLASPLIDFVCFTKDIYPIGFLNAPCQDKFPNLKGPRCAGGTGPCVLESVDWTGAGNIAMCFIF